MTADERRLADPVEKVCREWLTTQDIRRSASSAEILAILTPSLTNFVREQRLEAAIEERDEGGSGNGIIIDGQWTSWNHERWKKLKRDLAALRAEREGKGVTE